MFRNAHKVVKLYYSMFYQLFIHLFYSYVFILFECMYRANQRPYEARTGKPDTPLLTYTTVDV